MKGEGLGRGQPAVQIRYPQPRHDELGKFPGYSHQPFCFQKQVWFIGEEARVLMPYHSRARAGGSDNDLGLRKCLEELHRHLPCLVAITGIEGGLPTAGLTPGKVHLEA